MLSALGVFLFAAVACAGAAFWGLRAYRDAGGRHVRGSMIIAVAVILVGLGVYLAIGSPESPDAPYQARLQALKGRDPTTFNADEALAILAEAAKENPRDPLPHFYSGQLLLNQGRAREAARAYDSALRREPELAEAMLGLGRAMVSIEEGRVTPEALALFQQVAPLTNDPAPWIYQAMAAMQAGRDDEVRRLWGEALQRMAPDDPRRGMAQQMIDQPGR